MILDCPPAPPRPMILFIVVTFCQDLPVNIHTEAKCGLPFAKQLYADGRGMWWVSMAPSTVPDTRPDSQAGHDPSYLLVLWEASIRMRVLSLVWLHAPLTPTLGGRGKWISVGLRLA